VSREVFIDASAWIAVSDMRDKYHSSAKAAYKRLVGDRRILITSNLVVAEAYIIIRRTGGHAQAMRFLQSLRGSARLMKVYSDAELESIAEELLEKYMDHDFSFADAVSFAVMQTRGIKAAFTFDRHFATMDFQMLPT
jgi:hypothetical protein